MDCNTCKERQKQAEPVPFIVHEGAMARAERTHKRKTVVIIILLLALILTNAGWIWYESSFIEEEWTFDAYSDGDGNAIANGNGEVYYYGFEGKSNEKNPDP